MRISISPGVSDCGLLDHYYSRAPAPRSTQAQRAAINGHAVAGTCGLWENTSSRAFDPSDGCDPAIPKAKIYDAKTNPTGFVAISPTPT